MAKKIHLTKTKFLSGLRCDRKLWLDVHDPQPYTDPKPGSVQEAGMRIGRHAQEMFSGGIEIDDPPWEHGQAVRKTMELISDPNVSAIFEAAFEFDGIRIRVDVLERMDDGSWGLREVKSCSAVREGSWHLEDVAVQLHVLEKSSLKITSAQLIHINTDYVRESGGIDWSALFTRAELIAETRNLLNGLPVEIKRQKKLLKGNTAPKVEPTKSLCLSPYECDHWQNCTANKPEDWVANLYYLRPAQFEKFRADGIEAVSDIPDEYPLNANQETMRRVTISGEPYVSEDLGNALSNYGPPAFYLDFETISPAIPPYEGTSPYQQTPFQWSIHHADPAGNVSHWEFLAEGNADPRKPLAEEMLSVLEESNGPILTYNAGFEKRVIFELATFLPDLADRLRALNERILDLLVISRGYTYFPGYNFSFSLKTVGPTLAPGINYDELEGVSGGLEASATFQRLADGNLREDEDVATIRKGLLAYCKLDTLALVETHRKLIELTS